MTDDKEHVTDLRVAVARLEEQVATIKKAFEGKAGREWTIIATGLGLMGTIIAKNLGWY